MVKDGELYFIDFQGGRMGPLNYDVVSLLYQVKAQIPQAVRDELIQYYKEELKQFVDPEEECAGRDARKNSAEERQRYTVTHAAAYKY